MCILYGHIFFLLFMYGNVKDSHQLSTNDKNACKSDTGIECCYGYILSKDRSRCEDCPAGLYGNSCSYKCPNGQYGVRCSSECKCSGNHICDRVEGCKLKTRFWKELSPCSVRYHLKPQVQLEALVTNDEGKEKSTRYSTAIQPTRRPSTSIEEGTSDIDTVVLYRSQNREEKTSVVYVMYSSGGALAFACILLFLIGIIFIFKRLGSSKIVPIYDEIPEDLLQSDVAINRPVVGPQKCGYYKDNTHVLLSKQHSGNLEGSKPPSYYNDKKDYDYAYQKSDDYYLNPYNILQTTGYSDHLYHELKE